MSERWDVVVVGAGPAGIAAAVRAAEAGARVALVDDNPAAGGQIWRAGIAPPTAARKWLARLDAAGVTRMQGWRVFDAGRLGDSAEYGSLRAERSGSGGGDSVKRGSSGTCADISYKSLIIATGARERFLPFPGWTLPNVMGAGGLDAMVRGGLPIAGRRVVVAGTGPLLLAVAAHLVQAGAEVAAICEQAEVRQVLPFAAGLVRQPGKVGQGIALRFAARKAKLYTRCWPVAARGRGQLESITLRRGGRLWDMACDYLACGYDLVPNVELPLLVGCRVEDGLVAVDDRQQTSVGGVYCAGEPTGIGGVDKALLEGQIAGLAAAGRMAEAQQVSPQRRGAQEFVRSLRKAFALNAELRRLPVNDTVICRCEDVPLGALRERGSWRDAKLHTRCGMGACQGRICGAATEFLFGWAADSVRPPIVPVRVASLGSAVNAETQLIANQLISNQDGEGQ